MFMSIFNVSNVSRDKVIEMLTQEQAVRYSKGIQEAYTQQFIESRESEYVRVNIEAEIQKFILRKFGFSDSEESLEGYWKIPSTYWHDEEVKNSIFYMKLNIFEYPNVKINDDLIDVNLINYQTNELVSLSSLATENKPLVVLAGSMT